MPQAPFKFTDRRERNGYTGGGRLFEATDWTAENARRRYIPSLDVDSRSNVGDWSQRRLISASRAIFARFGPLRGAVSQMIQAAIGDAGSFGIQYRGTDTAWGEAMEETIREHNRICEVRGAPWDFHQVLKSMLQSCIIDGSGCAMLVDFGTGYPFIQLIPSHRVGSSSMQVESGQYKGANVCNGIVLDSYNRPIAYRLADGDYSSEQTFTDIPAENFIYQFKPEMIDQVGGLPWLASVINDVEDLKGIRSALLTAIKSSSTRAVVEHNESGQADSNPILGGPSTRAEIGAPTIEKLDNGTITYFRAGTDSKIEFPTDNRPSTNTQDFSFEILRGCFEALGYPVEMYDASRTGGAVTRLVVAKAVRTIEQLQGMATAIARRFDIWRISKLAKLGIIPTLPADFYKFDYQLPRSLTVDNGRDTKADIELFNAGLISGGTLTGGMGEDVYEVIDARIAEEAYINSEAKKAGVDPLRIRFLNNAPQAPAEQPRQTP